MSETYPWEQYPLHELEAKGIATLGRGNIISKIDIQNNPGGYPIYSSSAKGEGLFGTYGDYMFDEEMITWSVDGGGTLFYRPRHRFSVTNVSGYMRLDTSVLDYRFAHAALALQHSKLTFDYQTKAHPSVIRNLYHLPIPPLPEQKKIAEILSGFDLLIRKNEKRVQKLQLSHASLSAKAFQIELEKEQLAVALGDVVALRHGYQFRTPDFAQYGAKVIKISQVIGDGAVLTEDCDRVPWELAADKEKFRLRPGDVLMSLTGNIGRVGVVPKTDEVLLQNYRVGLFAPVDERISRKYMIHLLESRQVVSQLEDNANASAQANFGKGDLDKIMVYLPDLQKQEKTASLLSSSKDLIKAEKRKIAALQKAKLSISADLLSGRKRVSV